MDAGERELFARALVGALDAAADTDVALVDLGWADALVDDPQAAVSALFDWQGSTARSSGALHRVVGVEVLPRLGSTAPPGRIVGDVIEVHGLVLAATRQQDPDVLPQERVVGMAADGTRADGARGAAGIALHRGAGLSCRAVEGLDPTLGLVEVRGSVPLTDAVGTVDWDRAIAAGQRALSHELVGAARGMLELAREHALDRIQFGVPIASFQAVRHRLADSLVAIESAAALVDAAWEQPDGLSAGVAKAVAGRSAHLVAKHCQQVLAGIGFTAEHPLHRYLRRVRLLDGLLGDARTLTRDLGQQLLETRRLPPLLPL
jgi:alkylation response protein AidB-like acyl-CoA dehydrogenase